MFVRVVAVIVVSVVVVAVVVVAVVLVVSTHVEHSTLHDARKNGPLIGWLQSLSDPGHSGLSTTPLHVGSVVVEVVVEVAVAVVVVTVVVDVVHVPHNTGQ